MLLLQGIGAAIRAMSWGILLLLLANFIVALLLTKVIGQSMFDGLTDPEREETYWGHFGNMHRSMFTLYMFTMEFQGDTCRDSFDDGPWLTFFLLVWTWLSCFALLGTI